MDTRRHAWAHWFPTLLGYSLRFSERQLVSSTTTKWKDRWLLRHLPNIPTTRRVPERNPGKDYDELAVGQQAGWTDDVFFQCPGKEGYLVSVDLFVQALTSVGAGAEIASNVTTGYNPGAPESPTKPIILPEETSLLMRWQNGAEGHSPIKGHLIQAKRIGIVTDQNKTLMIDDDVMDEGDRGGEEMKVASLIVKSETSHRLAAKESSSSKTPSSPILRCLLSSTSYRRVDNAYAPAWWKWSDRLSIELPPTGTSKLLCIQSVRQEWFGCQQSKCRIGQTSGSRWGADISCSIQI